MSLKSTKTLSQTPSLSSTNTSKGAYLPLRFHQNTLRKFKKSIPDPIRENFEDEIMSFFIHVADLSGATKNYDLSKVWAKKINKEFTVQYEAETKLGIPQTAHFKGLDDEYIFHKNECGFRKFIILPLYDTMKRLDHGFFRGQGNKGLKVVHRNGGRLGNGEEDKMIQKKSKEVSDSLGSIIETIKTNISIHENELVRLEDFRPGVALKNNS
jgi:hypothetical protein